MTATILIVGKSFRRLTDYLTEQGFDYRVLADALRQEKPSEKRIACDFSSTESMLETVDSLEKTVHLNGVITIYEKYILPAAKIAEHLNLPGLPVSAAEACTDKDLMRRLFAKSTESISPDFAVVDSVKDIKEFAETHSFPLILKPANLAKSLLVTKNHDLSELLKNYELAASQLDMVYQKYAPNRTPKLLVEEFLEGSIHSVDAFVGADGEPKVLEQVVDYQTGYDVGYDDNFHYSRLLPSKLPVESVAAIRHAASVGCRSLGMKNSPAHIEVILTKNGPKIVEIGARNGGYRERMHSAANGIDIVGNAIRLALGETVDIQAQRNDCCAVLELFPKINGVFSHISRQAELLKLPSLAYFNCKAKPGQQIGKSAQGHKMSAVIMLHSSDKQKFDKDLEFVNRHVYVVTTGAIG